MLVKKKKQKLYRKENILKKFFLPAYNIFAYRFLIPSSWQFCILKNHSKNLYVIKLYTTSYYYNFSVPKQNLLSFLVDRNIRLIYFSNYTSFNTANPWAKELAHIIFLFTSFFFIKIKFRGKGYYIYKNKRNTIAPQFGYAHRIYIYSFFNYVKFLTKTKVLIFGFIKKDIVTNGFNIKKQRSINIFTGKGVRFAKQVVYKKTGKVSAYR